MLAGRRLVVDTMCEVHKLLAPLTNEEFWDFAKVRLVPGSVYVLGRQHLLDNLPQIKAMADTGEYVIVFDNSAEGSWTLETQIRQLKIDQLCSESKILLVVGGSISEQYPHIVHEHLLTTILDYDENIYAQSRIDEIFTKSHKPYTFLFLNGRARPHRKYLYEKMRHKGLLEFSLWTMLDNRPTVVRHFSLREGDTNIMATSSELRRLPQHYEVDRYRESVFGPIIDNNSFIKQELFHEEWGEIYLEPAPYVDTYFSLVTETVCCESDLSFRTEKVAKPLAMGHPFIIAANRGYYRDLRRLGFRTFNHIIDESFDEIDHAQDRMDRLIAVVDDLCKTDLDQFLDACREVCKYNQQHLNEFATNHRKRFVKIFSDFIKIYG